MCRIAKELKRPISVHCVRAFGDLLDIMKSIGPFPEGFLMAMKENKAKKMLKTVPSDRILLETDAPDALPKSNNSVPLFSVEDQYLVPKGVQPSDGYPKEILNHPASIHFVLSYVAFAWII